eukprot:scaffold4241_cov164-Amphora_coffeaeformis.AAC.5
MARTKESAMLTLAMKISHDFHLTRRLAKLSSRYGTIDMPKKLPSHNNSGHLIPLVRCLEKLDLSPSNTLFWGATAMKHPRKYSVIWNIISHSRAIP